MICNIKSIITSLEYHCQTVILDMPGVVDMTCVRACVQRVTSDWLRLKITRRRQATPPCRVAPYVAPLRVVADVTCCDVIEQKGKVCCFKLFIVRLISIWVRHPRDVRQSRRGPALFYTVN